MERLIPWLLRPKFLLSSLCTEVCTLMRHCHVNGLSVLDWKVGGELLAFLPTAAYVENDPKVASFEVMQEVQQARTKYTRTKVHFEFTGEEFWMFYASDNAIMWVDSTRDVDKMDRLLHFRGQLRSWSFQWQWWSGSCHSVRRPRGRNRYFRECMFQPWVIFGCREAKKSREGRVMVHCDTAPIHKDQVLKNTRLI
jgi:hypothetical protein